MDKLIVKARDWYANIDATRIVREESIIFAYHGEELVGVFDLGAIDALYGSKEGK